MRCLANWGYKRVYLTRDIRDYFLQNADKKPSLTSSSTRRYQTIPSCQFNQCLSILRTLAAKLDPLEMLERTCPSLDLALPSII